MKCTQLKTLRVSKGLTQKELAKKLGTSQTVVSSWESGKAMPNIKNAVKMANFFEVSPEVLLSAFIKQYS